MYFFLPEDEKKGSAENFAAYTKLLREGFGKLGMVEAPKLEEADFGVMVECSVGEEGVQRVVQKFARGTGLGEGAAESGGYQSGLLRSSESGMQEDVHAAVGRTRVFMLGMVNAKGWKAGGGTKPKVMYTGAVIVSGMGSELRGLFPAMTGILFRDFPGDGETMKRETFRERESVVKGAGVTVTK